jgi:hypothetical protein
MGISTSWFTLRLARGVHYVGSLCNPIMEDLLMVARANLPNDTSLSNERIATLAKQIRNQWSPQQREFRAQLARVKVARLAPFLIDQIDRKECAIGQTVLCEC